MNFRKIFLLLSFGFMVQLTLGQTLPPHLLKYQENKKLTWRDFQEKPDMTNKYYALTNSGISYSYNATKREGKLSLTFDVFSYFNKSQSWGKGGKQTPELLAHEQLHFDITEMHARLLKKAFDNFTFTDHYKKEIEQLTNTVLQASYNMQARYDAESDHSVNQEKQKEWEVYVATELARLDKTTAALPVTGK